MKAVIRDLETFGGVRPLDLVSYLRTHRWTLSESSPNRWSVWQNGPTEDATEVLVPLDSRAPDFALRIADVFHRLGQVEDRSEIDILSDVATASSDVLRIRAHAAEFQDGTVPLAAGVAVVEQAREILLAAACATLSPRPVFHTRKLTRATDFVSKVRLGQTERGSFVVTVHSPVPPMLQSTSQDTVDSEPFERRVIINVMNAIIATREARQVAAATGTLEPFERAVALGVSANLCGALASLLDWTGCEQVSFSTSWAPVRPLASEVPANVVLPRDAQPVLREAVRMLRQQHSEAGVEVLGYVVKLARNEGESLGEATVVWAGVGGGKRVRIVGLSEQSYALAVEAHGEQRMLRVVGDLGKEGRAWVLRLVRDAEVVVGEEED